MEERITNQTPTAISSDTAKEYLQAGLSILPANRCDKCPTLGSWTEYQHRRPNERELENWFSRRPDAICIV